MEKWEAIYQPYYSWLEGVINTAIEQGEVHSGIHVRWTARTEYFFFIYFEIDILFTADIKPFSRVLDNVDNRSGRPSDMNAAVDLTLFNGRIDHAFQPGIIRLINGHLSALLFLAGRRDQYGH